MGVSDDMSTHVPDRHAVKPLARKVLLDREGLERTLSRIAHEIIERNDDLERVALVGIHTRGVPLAERLAALIEERSGEEIALGAVDITFHRDDTLPGQQQPAVHVDRGHRELPIRPDYVGKNLPTARSERIQVELEETDGTDRILLVGTAEEGS